MVHRELGGLLEERGRATYVHPLQFAHLTFRFFIYEFPIVVRLTEEANGRVYNPVLDTILPHPLRSPEAVVLSVATH